MFLPVLNHLLLKGPVVITETVYTLLSACKWEGFSQTHYFIYSSTYPQISHTNGFRSSDFSNLLFESNLLFLCWGHDACVEFESKYAEQISEYKWRLLVVSSSDYTTYDGPNAATCLKSLCKELYVPPKFTIAYLNEFPFLQERTLSNLKQYAKRIAGVYQDRRIKGTGHPSSWFTEKKILDGVLGGAQDIRQVLWGKFLTDGVNTYVIDRDYRLLSRKGVLSSAEEFPNIQALKTSGSELEHAIYQYLFYSPDRLKDALQDAAGGYTLETAAEKLLRRPDTFNDLLHHRFEEPYSSQSASAKGLQGRFSVRRPKLLYGQTNEVDGFTLEVLVLGVGQWDMAKFVKSNRSAIETLAIETCQQTSWMQRHDGLRDMLFISSLSYTTTGIIDITVAIKGGNISHK